MKKIFILLLTMLAVGRLFAAGKNQGTAANPAVKMIRILTPNYSFDMNDGVANPVLPFIEKSTGYTLDFSALPAENGFDKLNAIMAAGAEDFDIIQLTGSVKDRYTQYASQGALMDMAPLVNDAPNIKAFLTQQMLDIVMIGNTYFCIPGFSASARPGLSSTPDGWLFIRTDLMKKIGRTTLPKTLDDFTSMLQAYKDQDPMKIGNQNIPLVASIGSLNELRQNGIGGAFGVELDWKDINGTLEPYQTDPGFFEFLQYLRDLYVKGLMDPEMPTNTGSAIAEKFTTNKVLVRTDGWWDVPNLKNIFGKSYPEATYEYIQPLEKNGKAGARVLSPFQLNGFTMIPKGAKNYKAAMDFLNKLAEPAVYKEAVIGREGIEHIKNAQGGYEPILPTFFDVRGNGDKYAILYPPVYGEYWLARAKKDPDQYKAMAQLCYGDYAAFLHIDPSSDLPCAVYGDVVQPLQVSNTLTSEFMVNSIVSGITKAQYDAFVKDWKVQAGDRLSAIYNGWYKNRRR